MITSKDKKDCCGCAACMSACNKKAITMVADNTLGFLYPQINTSLCVNCGKCDLICQFKDNYNRYDNYNKPYVYAMRPLDEKELMKSQSGAAFFILSNIILEEGGTVYGAVFDEKFNVIHSRATTKEEREKMRMSKYVQSDIQNIYPLIKNDLLEGKKVLFSGTPCQVAAIRSFLGKKLSEKLYTIDIICHGVPSPKVWSDYLKYLKKKYHKSIISIITRDKKYGWASHNETYILEDGTKKTRATFRELFYRHYIVRDSCSNCKFTNTKRVSDITIGDFWGWEKYHNDFMDNKGISLIYINSDKGKELFEKTKSKAIIIPSNIQESLQPQLQHPIALPNNRQEFINDYKKHNFRYIANKYSDTSLYYQFHSFIFNLLAKLKK